MIRVLFVDDDPQQLELAERILSRQSCEVFTTSTAAGLAGLVRDHAIDVVLVDVNLPGMSSGQVVEVVRREAGSAARIVLYSAADADQLRKLAAEVSADAWIQKGLGWTELAGRLRRLCGK